MRIEVTGTEQLSKVAGAIATFEPTLRKELLRGMRESAKPAIRHVKDAALRDFPAGGGLNKFAQKSAIGVRTRTSGKDAGVRIIALKKGHDVRAMDRGEVRHPLWGNRKHWYPQSVKPGFFTATLSGEGEQVQVRMLEVMDETLHAIGRKLPK